MNKQPHSHYYNLFRTKNNQGINLVWHSNYEERFVWAETVIPDYLNNSPGITHNGIVAVLLDEMSFRAIELQERECSLVDRTFVTAKLNINFINPTPTDKKIKVIGKIEKAGQKRYETIAKVMLLDGTVTAQCNTLFMQAQLLK